MVQLDRFEITFNNPEEAFFAGQEISGKVIIENKEPKKANEILLEIKGRARTYWTKHSGKSRKHCSRSDPYFLEQFNTGYTHNLQEEGGKDRILPAGRHEIPFSYTLPKTLPTSFEGEFGHVRYTCKAICERPWDFDIVSLKAFTVIGIEDINSDPKLNEPSCTSESDHAVQFCCRSSGSVTGELKVPKTGYTPGEKINTAYKVKNCSSKTRSVALRFVQTTVYKAKTFAGTEHTKTIRRIVQKIEKPEVAARESTEWIEQEIFIPSLCPRLGKCKVVSVTYAVELEVEKTLVVPLPIVLGSIPQLSQILIHSKNSNAATNGFPKSSIKDSPPMKSDEHKDEGCVQVRITDETGTLVEEMSGEMDALLSARKRVRMPSSILSELYPTMPSPYYRESFFGACNILEEKEQVQFGDPMFAPKYPFYSDDLDGSFIS